MRESGEVLLRIPYAESLCSPNPQAANKGRSIFGQRCSFRAAELDEPGFVVDEAGEAASLINSTNSGSGVRTG